MNQITGTALIACVFATGLPVSALAQCPSDLPLRMFEDCMVVEGSGASFPHADYAYRKEYEAWMKLQTRDTDGAQGQVAAARQAPTLR